jgi:Group II intron, maturase-specific domain
MASHRAVTAGATTSTTAIKALGPVITGCSRDYDHVVSKAIFGQMYHRVHHQLRRWAAWRHPHKGYRWRIHRYWQRKDGVIVFGKTQALPRHPETSMTRHVKVTGTRSTYDGDWAYWSLRLRRYAGLAPREQKLLRVQSGKCGECGLYVTASDWIEVHHKDRDRMNYRFANLMLLHRHWHDTMHRTYDTGHQVEKLHDRKRSRAVLQRQGRSNPPPDRNRLRPEGHHRPEVLPSVVPAQCHELRRPCSNTPCLWLAHCAPSPSPPRPHHRRPLPCCGRLEAAAM